MKSKLNQIPLRLLMLVCMGWLAVAAQAQLNVTNIASGKTYRIKCGGSQNDAPTYPYLYDNNGKVLSQAYDDANPLQQWVVTAVNGKDGFYRVSGKTRLVRVPPRRQQKRKTRTSISGILCSFAS